MIYAQTSFRSIFGNNTRRQEEDERKGKARMGEVQDGSTADIGRTPAALNFARAYYAGALLAAKHRPDDPQSQQRAAEAWKEYKKAARKAGRSSTLLPDDLAHEPG